jgi:TolB-like protein
MRQSGARGHCRHSVGTGSENLPGSAVRDLGRSRISKGSLAKAGNRLRLPGGRLIDALNGAHIRADRFDSALDDLWGRHAPPC